MSEQFDKEFWEGHWSAVTAGSDAPPPHPVLDAEFTALDPGTALDAGAGEGAEAAWLAAHGWEVTAVDISAEALRRASRRVSPRSEHISWIEADLTSWQPSTSFDLVTTFYAHPTIPQLAFYERIATWVAPGGTLLIVGHGQTDGHGRDHSGEHGRDHSGEHRRDHSGEHGRAAGHTETPKHVQPHPEEAVTDPERIRSVLDPAEWDVQTAEVRDRAAGERHGHPVTLRDVVVRARRR
ncbi:MAG: class I SAM-dependent methyltransferase [Humibacter sp.]